MGEGNRKLGLVVDRLSLVYRPISCVSPRESLGGVTYTRHNTAHCEYLKGDVVGDVGALCMCSVDCDC